MTKHRSGGSESGFVSVTELAAEFGKDSRAISRWLLQHDIAVSRRAVLCESTQRSVMVVTNAEASAARFLHEHDVLLQEIS